jgi:hypothetical protein
VLIGTHFDLGEASPNVGMHKNAHRFAWSLGSHFENRSGDASSDHGT